MSLKVLIHTPVSNRAWILPTFLEALSAQSVPEEIKREYSFDVNDSQDSSQSIIENFQAASQNNVRINVWDWPHLEMDDHKWSVERYRRMIALRNSALAEAREHRADFLFSVDSDVILENPYTLAHLIETDVPIIAGVFMARWGNPEAIPLPNVWQRGQNQMTDTFLSDIATAKDHTPVGGLGACTLIRRDVWDAGVNYDSIHNLPSDYRGEDRYFCIRAAVAGFALLACSHMNIRHVDR